MMRLIEQYRETVSRSDYMMHALGGMDGKYTYTDSMDALQATYAAGYRLFEVDVKLTSDGKPVLVHGWGEADYQKRIGTENYKPELADEKGRYIPTYDDFMKFKIKGKYKATDFAELAAFMHSHGDMYVMIDVGNRHYADTAAIYSAMAAVCAGMEPVLDRCIAGGHTTEMMDAVRSVYDFKIFNLYFAAEKKRQAQLMNPKDFIDYCKANHIQSMSVASNVFTDTIAAAFQNSGLIIYVFTVNDLAEAKHLREKGATVIGTDFLR